MSISSHQTKNLLTPEQQAVVNFNIEDILIVNAYAGTGKTSTLIQFCEARKDKKILYLSYNASMRKEAETKFKHLSNVEVKTMHSLAYEELGLKYKDRLGSLRAMDLYPLVKDLQAEFHSFYATAILKTLRAFCNVSLPLKDFLENVIKNPKDYDLNPKLDLTYIASKTTLLWKKLESETCALAYEHDFYLKAYQLSKAKLEYDYILVDEAQDINGCVIDIVLNQEAKKVFIGDTYQSIYKFRGAINSLELLAKKPKAHTLYLTQSFRCPSSIAKIANCYLKILNAPKDFQGTPKSTKEVTKQQAIITRTNAKLFDIAIENLDKKLFLVGGVQSYNFDELLDIQNLLFKKQEFIKNPFIAKFKDLKELLTYIEETKEIDLRQKIFVLFKYIHSDIKKLIKDIEKACVKNENKADLILSTGHKSKGLEWDNVELSDDFLNLKQTLDNDEFEITIAKEELNLLYVAITRSKHSLSMSEDYVLDEDIINNIKERVETI
ncbi:UvrD-helicase domain-containing protein [Campylobacter helveticus]|uniref:DNA 3'-5' helicase n=1 Tax=Campylobacter helveticus TaxID=28898 RepID=A0AAX2UL59_9BACT|nr:UvrD-helicase domain-containing protein [Campylobacter helveticus]QBL11230.1 ATP-dependent helicase [Campylobacter helveticus]TNB58788.1 ATP-dependent helicase [Campylobacter helveticus]